MLRMRHSPRIPLKNYLWKKFGNFSSVWSKIGKNVDFKWMRLDAPEHGSLFIILRSQPQNPKLPGDGYRWLNPELVVRQQDIEIAYRLNGQKLQDMSQIMNKIRYRWLGNRNVRYFQIIHYLHQVQIPQLVNTASKLTKSIPGQYKEMVDPNVGNIPQNVPIVPPSTPKNPYTAYYLTSQRQGPGQMGEVALSRSSMLSLPSTSTLNAPLQNQPMQPLHPQHLARSSEDTLIDDIPELISVRDLAAKRYARNHEYMDEILSPKTAGKYSCFDISWAVIPILV